jgi:hypothetical protein
VSEPLVSPNTPPRFTAEEQQRYRDLFAPEAQKYRTNMRRAMVVFASAFAILLTGFALPKSYGGWIVGGFFICWLIFFIFVIMQSSLRCPACRGDLMARELGTFCPECGAGGLAPGGWFIAPRCAACRKRLWRGKSRHYRIRACTHCGLKVDEKGF